MLVSHESPICILEDSLHYNDYDYALCHLIPDHPEYYSFFKCSLASGREVLLDNSIFELGESFSPGKYRKYVEELNPTFYIVPDVLEDYIATTSSWRNFICQGKLDTTALKIGVVQGKTYQDLVNCYKFMSDNADYIAISFDYSWYNKVSCSNRSGRLGELDRWCSGRQHLIHRLIDDGVWDKTKPHHLLGASLAREFKAYVPIADEFNIRSIDTSNPVVAGLTQNRYIANTGLNHKPSVMLADLITVEVGEETLADIHYNAAEFKKIINR